MYARIGVSRTGVSTTSVPTNKGSKVNRSGIGLGVE